LHLQEEYKTVPLPLSQYLFGKKVNTKTRRNNNYNNEDNNNNNNNIYFSHGIVEEYLDIFLAPVSLCAGGKYLTCLALVMAQVFIHKQI
jgi:hypothetical protein